MKNFGETLKKLRKQKDMTQEQLAEYVNISPQSVSKWETNLTLPDITLLPVLANIFDVSADLLLGIDITVKNERIEKIEKEAINYLTTSRYEEAEKLLRGALKEYPNSYELMSTLVITIRNIAWNKEKTDTVRKTLNDEIVSLCEKIIAECTDDKIRQVAIQQLCYTYCDMNEHQKALDLADKLPGRGTTRDYLRGYALKGTEKFKHNQQEIKNDMRSAFYAIMYLNHESLDGEVKAYTPDETAALNRKIIDIINILCEDGDYGDFSDQLRDAHNHLCDFYFHKDNAAALKHFRLAAKYTILSDKLNYRDDTSDTQEYTSLLFRGMKIGAHRRIAPNSLSKYLLDKIKNQDYYCYFPYETLNEICAELQIMANPV